MRIDGNSAYDRGEEDRCKWNYRYTMVTIIAILLIFAAAMVVWDDSRTWLAEEEQGGNIETNDEREDYIIGEGGLKVVQPVPTVDSRDKPAPKPQDSQGSRKEIVNPVEGGVIVKGFSGNELVYNATLDQYMVHQGVDIEAAPETPVTAVKGGTVTKVYNDDKLGITIEISHGDGYVTRYCNLSTDRMVEEGDVVEAGDVISGVGITALFESSDPPHLHFEVLKDGIPIDPAEFIALQ